MPKTATKRPMTLAEYKAKNEKANKDTRSPLAKAVGWDANKTQFIRDLLTGGNDVAGRGMIAGMLGAPGDIAGLAENSLRGLIGKPQVQPWGGSEHIGQTLEQAGLVSDVRRPKTELLASLISPGAAAKTVLNAPKTAMTALRWMDNLDSAPTMARMGQRGAIDVWHGSPHTFDQFKAMDNVGAGEGAQAYGHGGYHASNPEVAQGYTQDLVHGHRQNIEIWKKQLDHIDPSNTEQVASINREVDRAKRELEAVIAKNPPSGNLYRNQLRWPDPAREASDPLSDKHFLDWDKPLSEHDAGTLEILSKLRDVRHGSDGWSLGDTAETILAAKQNGIQHLIDDPKINITGNDVLGLLGGATGKPSVEASNILRQAGIPGIRYLDGGSRSAGAGTHNYVTFDDSLVNILERNGQPVTAPQPGLLGKMVAPQDEALRVAQANAAKPVEEGGLGLRPDNTPEERAAAMGYTTDAYHGTMNPVDKVDLGQAMAFRDTDAPIGTALVTSTSPDVASTYAASHGGNFGSWDAGVVQPLLVNKGRGLTMNAGGRDWSGLPPVEYLEDEFLGGTTNQFAQFAKKAGYDSASIDNVDDVGVGSELFRPWDSRGTTTFHFDPRNIRSRFAAFDPMRRDSSDLLAGIAPFGAIPWLRDEQP